MLFFHDAQWLSSPTEKTLLNDFLTSGPLDIVGGTLFYFKKIMF